MPDLYRPPHCRSPHLVHHQRTAVQAQTGEQNGLAVLLGDFNVPATIASCSVRSLPTKQRCDNRTPLPVKQLEWLASPLAFRVAQELVEECPDALGSPDIEYVSLRHSTLICFA